MGYYTDKSLDYYMKHKKQAKELISEIANDLIEYNEDYEIVDNPHKNEFPYAVKLKVLNSDIYLGYQFSEVLYMNEDLDALYYEYDGQPMYDVTHSEWIYLGYAYKLSKLVQKQKEKIQYLEEQLNERANAS